MKRYVMHMLLLLLCLLLSMVLIPGAMAEDDPADAMISAVIQGVYPDYTVYDCAPVGKEGSEYIVLAGASAEKPAVLIVNADPVSPEVEFCNTIILDETPSSIIARPVPIPSVSSGTLQPREPVQQASRENNRIQLKDHLADGNPSLWLTNTESPAFMYLVFHRNDSGRWFVAEAQFGDYWNDFYWFRYEERDQQLHMGVLGNELSQVPVDRIDLDAETFDPQKAIQACRTRLDPWINIPDKGNLEEFGLSLDEAVEGLRGTRHFVSMALPYSLDRDHPAFRMVDVTGDGCTDLCTCMMTGSGMVRVILVVYDPLQREKFVLDGYNYSYAISDVTDGRLVVTEKGPYGYGDPLTETTGTVKLEDGKLVFCADSEAAE